MNLFYSYLCLKSKRTIRVTRSQSCTSNIKLEELRDPKVVPVILKLEELQDHKVVLVISKLEELRDHKVVPVMY